MPSHFQSSPELIPIGKGREWRLAADLTFVSDTHGTFTIPAGFECDLSSIPLGGGGLARPTDWPQAGVLHDACYRGVLDVSRAVSDDLYREALLSLGCPSWVARSRWLVLRAVGWRAYRRG